MAGVLGGDLVGMSTTLETIAARELGAEVLGISLITNLAAGISPEPLSHEEVLEAGTGGRTPTAAAARRNRSRTVTSNASTRCPTSSRALSPAGPRKIRIQRPGSRSMIFCLRPNEGDRQRWPSSPTRSPGDSSSAPPGYAVRWVRGPIG